MKIFGQNGTIEGMILDLQTIILAMPIYKYGLLFFGVVVEGPLFTMLAGWLSFEGLINLFLAYVIIIAAEMVGDMLYYALGYWGRAKLVNKYAARLKFSPTRFKKIESLLHRHCGKTIIMAKLTHLAGVPFLVSAGLAQVPFFKFLFYNLIATLPKSLVFILLGYFLGAAVGTVNQYLEYGTFIVLGLMVAIIGGYLLLGKYFEKEMPELKN